MAQHEIVITIEEGAQARILYGALRETIDRLDRAAANLPLRSQDETTERYTHHDVGGRIRIALRALRPLIGPCPAIGTAQEVWVDSPYSEGRALLADEGDVIERPCYRCARPVELRVGLHGLARVPEHEIGEWF